METEIVVLICMVLNRCLKYRFLSLKLNVALVCSELLYIPKVQGSILGPKSGLAILTLQANDGTVQQNRRRPFHFVILCQSLLRGHVTHTDVKVGSKTL